MCKPYLTEMILFGAILYFTYSKKDFLFQLLVLCRDRFSFRMKAFSNVKKEENRLESLVHIGLYASL